MSKARIPWTREELNALIPKIAQDLDKIEIDQGGNIKPLPPMTLAECGDLFSRLLDIAATRTLTNDECFMHGQLLSCYRHAVQAEMLGRKGRYFVVSEDEITSLMADR